MIMEPYGGVYDEDDFLLKNETLVPCTSDDDDDLDSLWLQESSPFHCLQGSSASSMVMNFEDVSNANTPQKQPLPKAGKVRNSQEVAGFDDVISSQAAAKKRRLSADQVRYLEKTFEVDNKLEPDRKAQLARELGLQPRQVAIWFQNRRARCKTKLLQKDCDVLKSSYDRLKHDYDALYSENEKLQKEIDTLVAKLQAKEKGSEEIIKKERSDADDDDVKLSNTSSAKSDVLDSDSPRHCTDGDERGDSSHAFEAVGTITDDYEEDDSLSKTLLLHAPCFPKLEVADESSCYDNDCLHPNSCNLGFPVQDHGTWLWQI